MTEQTNKTPVFDFDTVGDHRFDGSIRWMQPEGRTDVLGMGTADMDYPCADCIREALRPVWQENTYHYKYKPESYYQAVMRWFRDKYGLPVEKSWISSVPGTIAAICIAIKKFSREGDYVLMQTPYFGPLRNTIEGTGRRFLENPLQLRGDRYEIDFADFERKIADCHPAVFLLINPQNPTGRAFTQEELERMVDICAAHNVRIISDEVHFLVTYDGHKHIPILAVSETARKIAVQIFSFSKGFNMMSLPHGLILIADPQMQQEWQAYLMPYNFHYASNSYAIAAVTAAAGGAGDAWLEAVTEYLKGNRDYFVSEVKRRGLPIRPLVPEAGYLLWIDCRDTGIPPEELGERFLEEAGIQLNNGLEHGQDGRGFIRLNFAVTRACLEEALDRMSRMFRARSGREDGAC